MTPKKKSSSTTAMLSFAMSVLEGGNFDLALDEKYRCTNYFTKDMQLQEFYQKSIDLRLGNFSTSEIVDDEQVKPADSYALVHME